MQCSAATDKCTQKSCYFLCRAAGWQCSLSESIILCCPKLHRCVFPAQWAVLGSSCVSKSVETGTRRFNQTPPLHRARLKHAVFHHPWLHKHSLAPNHCCREQRDRENYDWHFNDGYTVAKDIGSYCSVTGAEHYFWMFLCVHKCTIQHYITMCLQNIFAILHL